MRFTDIFIKRPVLSCVVNAVIVLLGFVTWFNLSVRQYPQIDHPVVTVITHFDGASPEIVEAQISRPLEDAFAGLEGLNFIVSQSEAEESKVKIFFHNSRSIDLASSDVRDRLGRFKNLPPDATQPEVRKADADADPIIYLMLYGDRFNINELNDYATRYLVKQVESIPSVASVDRSEGDPYEMHAIVDPLLMGAFGVTPLDIGEAIRRQNFKRPTGRLVGKNQEFLVTTKAHLLTPKEFNNIVLLQRDGYTVRLSDVGKSVIRSSNERTRVRFNGKNAIMLRIIAKSKSNPITISKDLHKQLNEMRSNLPHGMFLEVASDNSVFIKASIDSVYQAILEATLLVVLVVFFFLRSLRASIIPLITIPISLVSTFFILFIFDFTINILTLLAMVLAVGLVVDDAIMVLENVYRYMEKGHSPKEAAILGTREIQFSLIAMTLTLAAVYAPIALIQGITGKLFTEFALTLAGSVLISGFVALTLSPMMCSYFLKSHDAHSDIEVLSDKKRHAPQNMLTRISGFIPRFLKVLDQKYLELLAVCMRMRKLILSISFVIAVGSYALSLYVIKRELAPKEDQGTIRAVAISPYGASLQYLDRYIVQADDAFTQDSNIEKHLSVLQVGGESYFVGILKPWQKRAGLRCEDTLPVLQHNLEKIAGIRIHARCTSQSMVGGSSERPLSFVVQTNRPFRELITISGQVLQQLAQHPGVRPESVDWDLAAEGREYVVKVKRDILGEMGVDPDTIARNLEVLFSGRRFSRFERESKEFPVRIWIKELYRSSPEDILSMRVRGQSNNRQESNMIPLSDLIEIREEMTLPEIRRFGGMRSITLYAAIKPGFGLGNVYDDFKKHLELPNGYRIQEAGELRTYLQESQNTQLIFILSLVFIFLIMAAQFESIIDPLIIMCSVPLALAGAFVTLWVVPEGSLNIYSQIGLITLIGLITKHAILMVDFANRKQEEDGLTRQEAILYACHLRLRPILMTTFAMVLGALPLALATGPGAEARRQIGWVIVGGMSIGTIFTLFVIPLIYSYLSRKKHMHQLT